jgi:hypothetical protein
MDLRYFLESTVHAGYALAHSQTTAYFDLNRQALGDAKKATGQAHRWIEQDFPSHSAFIKDLKGGDQPRDGPCQRRQQRA